MAFGHALCFLAKYLLGTESITRLSCLPKGFGVIFDVPLNFHAHIKRF